jgi:hypothetical protein
VTNPNTPIEGSDAEVAAAEIEIEGEIVEAEAQAYVATEPTPAAAEGYADIEQFVGEFADQNIPDPATVITIRTSGGDTRYVPVPEGTTLTAGEAILSSGLTINAAGGFELYLNNAKVKVSDPVPAGSTLMVVASVKGG